MSLIDLAKNNSSFVSSEGEIFSNFYNDFFIPQMLLFYPLEDAEGEKNPLKIQINCKTGEVTISGKILFYNGTEMVETQEPIIENAGNMIKSNYLSIGTRKLPKDGKIQYSQCLQVSTNSKIDNLKINYKYMYL